MKFNRIIALALLVTMLLGLFACAAKQELQSADASGSEQIEDNLNTQKEGNDMQESAFRVGMAIADITPDHPVYLDGYEAHDESSYAVPETFTSDLNARVLVVDNGEDRIVIINVEQVFSGWRAGCHTMSESFIEKAALVCKTSTDNIMPCNTHSHQSFMTMDEKQEGRLLTAVKEAYARLAPATIGVGTYCTAFGASRDGNYTMDLTKPYDSQMNVIRFDNAETGEPIGLIYAVPMHNTLFGNGPGLRVRHNLLSCEFTGYTSRAIENYMGKHAENFVAMHVDGFYGNATGIAKGKYYAEDQDELIKIGGMFADEIIENYLHIETEPMGGTISADYVQTSIPCNKENQEYMKQFGNYTDMPLAITLGAFGDFAFIGVNFEPFSIIGARLKAESPYRTTMPAANVNGWKGYIPTKETVADHKSGAYEAECVPTKSPFDEAGEEAFYSEAISALCDLAGVTLLRTQASDSGVGMENGRAVYSFRFDSPRALDKLVLSFAQKARTDCASNFDLLVYDENGDLIFRKSYEDYSVNYIGEFLNEPAAVSEVKVIVKERYMNGSKQLDSLPLEVYGISFV